MASAYLFVSQKQQGVQVQEIVAYLDRLEFGEAIGKESARFREYKKLVEETLIDDTLNKLLKEQDLVLEKGTKNDIDNFYAVLSTLLLLGKPSNLVDYVNSIITHLTTKKDEKKMERLSNLSHLYNLFQDVSIKFNLLVAILDYARDTDQTLAIESLFDTMDIRLNELGATTAQRRRVFGLILKNIKDIKDWHINYVYDYWVKYFSAFDENEKIPTEIIDEAYQAVIFILKDTEILFTEQLIATPAMVALKNQKAEKYRQCYSLLEIYTGSDYAALKAFRTTKNSDKFFSSNGLNIDDICYKIRLLTLNSLAGKQTSLSYETITKSLEIDSSELELFVIDANSSGILDARIDQLNQKVVIRHAPSRQFDKKRWQALDEKLDKWKENMTHLLSILQSSKDVQ